MKARRVVLSTIALALLSGSPLLALKFISTWAAPEAKNVVFKGHKVAALVISDDMSLRQSGEEALARELSARGMTGVAAYRLIPTQELKDVNKARAWFEKTQCVGVVTLRPVSQDKVKRYTPDVWTAPYYSSLWGYYPYGWGSYYTTGTVTTDSVIVVESLIYQVSDGKLLWAGVVEATNPKTLQKLIGDIVKESAKKIEKRFK